MPFETKESQWNGYQRLDFQSDGHSALIIRPKENAKGNPWVWRAEFFGAFDWADRELLSRGWHIGYAQYSNLYGCPAAVEGMRSFYRQVTEELGLSPKPSIFGFSRGGLYTVNYAAAYPDSVSSLYLDAAVLDIRSWPGGKYTGIGSPQCWQECLQCYGLTEESVKNFRGNPLDHAAALAKAGIPVIAVAGDADEIVPYPENTEIFERVYRQNGGQIQVILKPGVGHHPHSLEDPEAIVGFIIEAFAEAFAGSRDSK
ncbi:MAG TPA: hypothetical protein DD727_08070 [Clostridiales bacterium]|nr:hypothetical protein [Clostridiales bacterium]